jgi:hypothetical protein
LRTAQFLARFQQLSARHQSVEFKMTWPLTPEPIVVGQQYAMENVEGQKAIVTGTRFGPVVLFEPVHGQEPNLQASETIKQILIYDRPPEVDGMVFILGRMSGTPNEPDFGTNIGQWIENQYRKK